MCRYVACCSFSFPPFFSTSNLFVPHPLLSFSQVYTTHGDLITSFAQDCENVFSVQTDGFHAVLGDGEGIVRLFDVSANTDMGALGQHHSSVSCLDVSGCGSYVASGAEDGTVGLWKVDFRS